MTASSPPKSGADLFADETLRDPYPLYRELRAQGPAVYMESLDAWALPRYDEVRTALSDWRLYSSEDGVAFNNQMCEHQKPTIQCIPPPQHDYVRGLMTERISPKVLRDLEPHIRAKAEALAGAAVAMGEFDAIEVLAKAFPLMIVTEMIGLPEYASAHLIEWGDNAFQAAGPLNDRCVAGFPVVQSMFEYLLSLGADDFSPGGLGEKMFGAARRGQLAHEEVLPLLFSFTGPAIDTTVSAIGHAIWRFAQHPDQWQAIRDDPGLIPGALTEVLRMDAPIQLFTRKLSEAATVGGVDLEAGTRVIVMYGSANRDERHYAEPDTFDIKRDAIDHLSFGYGLHGCVGQGLARLEVQALIGALAKRVVAFHGENLERPARHLNNLVRSIESLPVSARV